MNRRAIVPTLLTLGNAVCGLSAIAYASRIHMADTTPEMGRQFLAMSGWLIVIAMIFDTFDGLFARLFKAAGRFGAELDSLCDAISFGAAPAFLLLQLGPGRDQPIWHQLAAGVATLYMMCAVLRLARFNVESIEGSATKKFRGLPSPAAAGCLASLAILRGGIEQRWPGESVPLFDGIIEAAAVTGAVIVALLMVSGVGYPHPTKQWLRSRRSASWLVLAPAVVVISLLREMSLVVGFWAYALSFAARFIAVRAWGPQMSPRRVMSNRQQ